MRSDVLRIDHSFIRRHIEMQVLLVNTLESAQVCPKRRACPFTSIAVDFAPAIPVIIPSPLAHTVIALPLVGIELGAASGNVFGNQPLTGPRICVITYPEALLTRLLRDHADDRWAIVGIGAMPSPCMSAPTGWVGGIQMWGAVFPRRSGTVHRPRRRYQPSSLWEPSHSDWLGCVAAAYGAVSVRGLTPVPGARLARPWLSRVVTAPGCPAVAECSRRLCLSAAYSRHRRSDTDRRENAPVHGTTAALCSHSAGIAGPWGAGIAPAKVYRCCRPAAR
jgi:hypothetical protein